MSTSNLAERTLHTRPATPADFAFAWKVYGEAVRPMIEPKLKVAWDDDREERNFRSIWQPEKAHIVMLDGEPIGWGAITAVADSVTVDHFYLLEAHRGKGYGTRILESVITDTRREGKEVRADAVRDSRVVALCHRLGFTEVAEKSLIKSFVCK